MCARFAIARGPGERFFPRHSITGTYDYLSDILGSTVALTSTSGSIQTQYTYEPFGNTVATGQASSNPYQFTGRENDGSGLYFYRARYYNPVMQRFVSQDPMDFDAGDTDLYEYAKDSPATFDDPEGLQSGGPWHPPAGTKTKCTRDDSCSEITAKMYVLSKMINSHTGWDRSMAPPRGGGRHADEIAQLWKQLADCQAIYKEKNCASCGGSQSTIAAVIAALLQLLSQLAHALPDPGGMPAPVLP